ncbi:MAG: hypothetical protein ACE5FH_04665 [Candidatus Zixiibacteriota bacterium]
MKHLSKFVLLAGVILATVFCIMPAYGAMVEQTIDQLVDASELVAQARVTKLVSSWNDDHDFIFTLVTLTVEDVRKGNAKLGSTVDVLVPGGIMDGTGLKVEHSADFEAGQNVIVFLRPIDSDLFGVTAWEQGKYTVVQNMITENGLPRADFVGQIDDAIAASKR